MMQKALVVALLLLVPATVYAQGGRRGGGRGGGRGGTQAAMVNVAKVLVDARTQLTLSEEQVTQLTALQAQIDSVNKPHVDAITQIMAAGGGRRGGDPAQMEQLMTHATAARTTNDQTYETKIKPLLNAQQVTTADSLIAAARPQRGRRGGRGGGGGGF